MKVLKVSSGAVITAVAFAVSIFVLHPVSIAVPDKDIATGDEEFPTITTQRKTISVSNLCMYHCLLWIVSSEWLWPSCFSPLSQTRNTYQLKPQHI